MVLVSKESTLRWLLNPCAAPLIKPATIFFSSALHEGLYLPPGDKQFIYLLENKGYIESIIATE